MPTNSSFIFLLQRESGLTWTGLVDHLLLIATSLKLIPNESALR